MSDFGKTSTGNNTSFGTGGGGSIGPGGGTTKHVYCFTRITTLSLVLQTGGDAPGFCGQNVASTYNTDWTVLLLDGECHFVKCDRDDFYIRFEDKNGNKLTAKQVENILCKDMKGTRPKDATVRIVTETTKDICFATQQAFNAAMESGIISDEKFFETLDFPCTPYPPNNLAGDKVDPFKIFNQIRECLCKIMSADISDQRRNDYLNESSNRVGKCVRNAIKSTGGKSNQWLPGFGTDDREFMYQYCLSKYFVCPYPPPSWLI